MNRKKKMFRFLTVSSIILLFLSNAAFAADTCMFMSQANEVAPNIVFLLDTGAEMEQIIWHPDYDHTVDYTPDVSTPKDVTVSGASSGNGFFNPNGYTINGKLQLVAIDAQLNPLTTTKITSDEKKVATYTINGKTITLPDAPPTKEIDGVIDKANMFRFDANYLNWLFYSGEYTRSGEDLPAVTRFYYAKKAMMVVARRAANRAQFGIYNFTNDEGSSSVQPLGFVVNEPLAANPDDNVLDPNYVNNLNGMGSGTYSPLAEGLARIGGYFASSSSGVDEDLTCAKNYIIVVSPGYSSMDQNGNSQSYYPPKQDFRDYDNDNPTAEGDCMESDGEGCDADYGFIQANPEIPETVIPVKWQGSTFLDDMAWYLYNHDVVGYVEGHQGLRTYTVGFMSDELARLFLINTSNNGNGFRNLYDTANPEYGNYHFEADNPEDLATKILEAVNAILSRTSTFTAPVVPVTRTTSGDKVYMAFFKPSENNFWEGNVTKFGIDENQQIVDKYGNPATWPNGAMKQNAEPYWATKHWSDPTKSNYMSSSERKIYTYLASDKGPFTTDGNSFTTGNVNLTDEILGNPTGFTDVNGIYVKGKDKVIRYVRGEDVFDEDADGNTAENREIITGDVLHSEPTVVRYYYSGSVEAYVFYGANDGMIHCVRDDNGKEQWALIPPNQLNRLKQILEGYGHIDFVDSSPKVHLIDHDGDRIVDPADGDRAILVIGERKGGYSYTALDITSITVPTFMWQISSLSNVPAGVYAPTLVSTLGETWAEPIFGYVKTWAKDTTGILVMIVGGGYHENNMRGRSVVMVNLLNPKDTNLGVIEFRSFNSNTLGAMDYSFPSAAYAVDANDNGFIDKIYIGDVGGQMWRIGSVQDVNGDPVFPIGDEVVWNWMAQKFFKAADNEGDVPYGPFYYPPVVALEEDYDLVFMGTGDREDACGEDSKDRIYAVKDSHSPAPVYESSMTDVTSEAATPPDLDAGDSNGWFIQLATGEKVLSEGTVFFKTYYITTFTPTEDPCLPGGTGRLYALNYKTGESVIDFDGTNEKPFTQISVYDLPTNTGGEGGEGGEESGWTYMVDDILSLSEDTIFIQTAYTPGEIPQLPGGIGTAKLLAYNLETGEAIYYYETPLETEISLNYEEGWQGNSEAPDSLEGMSTYQGSIDEAPPEGAMIYATNYITGEVIYYFEEYQATPPDPERSIEIGGGIPSKPVLILNDNGEKLFISVGSTNIDGTSESVDAGIVALDPLSPPNNFFDLWWVEF